MKLNNRLWKHITALVVVLIILNPEMLPLALFIDAVGLDLFLLLLEVQALAILAGLLNTKIKPILDYIKYSFQFRFGTGSRLNPSEGPAGLILAMPGPVVFMYLLVFSAAMNITFLTR